MAVRHGNTFYIAMTLWQKECKNNPPFELFALSRLCGWVGIRYQVTDFFFKFNRLSIACFFFFSVFFFFPLYRWSVFGAHIDWWLAAVIRPTTQLWITSTDHHLTWSIHCGYFWQRSCLFLHHQWKSSALHGPQGYTTGLYHHYYWKQRDL